MIYSDKSNQIKSNNLAEKKSASFFWDIAPCSATFQMMAIFVNTAENPKSYNYF
jgi:hypothetical protein